MGKIVCIIFIALALLCTLERGKKKGGAVYYVGIFILNGMSGVIAKIFASSDLPKTSAAGFSIWCAAATVLLSGTSWFILSLHGKRTQVPEKTRTEPRVLLRSYGIGALMGAINKVANFLLVFSLSFVDASVQYPMVTGGTMIVSTVLSCFGDKKPTKREMISVCLAFVGLLALFLIPEKTK